MADLLNVLISPGLIFTLKGNTIMKVSQLRHWSKQKVVAYRSFNVFFFLSYLIYPVVWLTVGVPL